MALPAVTDELIAAAQCGDSDAMWTVVSAHDPIIKRLIRQTAPSASTDDADDLLQEGRAELISRIRSYDSAGTSAQLQTYAYTHVRRAIAEAHMRATTGLTVEPSALLRVRKALADYDGNREAAFLAVSARHGMERETFTAVMDIMTMLTVSFESSEGRSGERRVSALTLAEVITDPAADFTATTDRAALAHHLLSVVAPRQSYALAAFHGVGMMQTPDEDVAAHLQTPKHRVRQLRGDGVRSARSYADRCGIAA